MRLAGPVVASSAGVANVRPRLLSLFWMSRTSSNSCTALPDRSPPRIERREVLVEHAPEEPDGGCVVLEDQPVRLLVSATHAEAERLGERAGLADVLDGKVYRDGAKANAQPVRACYTSSNHFRLTMTSSTTRALISTPILSCFKRSTSSSPSMRSIGVAPARCASPLASRVNVPVVSSKEFILPGRRDGLLVGSIGSGPRQPVVKLGRTSAMNFCNILLGQTRIRSDSMLSLASAPARCWAALFGVEWQHDFTSARGFARSSYAAPRRAGRCGCRTFGELGRSRRSGWCGSCLGRRN